VAQLTSHTAVIVDEYPLWLDALEALLVKLEVEVVGRATNRRDADELIRDQCPDMVIADYAVVTENDSSEGGILSTAQQVNPSVRCVVLSESDDRRERDLAFAAGAAAFCIKRAEPDDLAVAIRQSFQHSIFFASSQAYPSAAPAGQPGTEPDAPVGLTKREVEILRLTAEGYSNSQLARMLWVTEQTVKFHLSNIYRKLGVANRTEASRWAQRNGLLTGERVGATAA
jgi:DNA-binding NarL/FixJ family response regulator